LRYWIITTTKTSPTRKLLQEIEKTLVNSQADANPVIPFSGFEFRKYQDDLYLLKPNIDKNFQHELANDLAWDTTSPLVISFLNIQLKAVDTIGEGLKKSLLVEPLTIRFRRGGEKFHPAGRRHSQSLKKLLQEANVPPWQRDVVPLLYSGDELVAVVGLWIGKGFGVGEGESGWSVGIEGL